ncbi:indolepyruvate oxidoreductase subunit beta family protein [Sphingomonas sp.]|uniref:indolepyruvate oxidoreductase subunit beta family protein n=1 Tax=Sphingomonas sp. TaxID=28214 RepID=UPI000DB87BB3|nr:indolepyruvate oxidoreductase subunit beta family protein [Sphingomonas sp.]PZU11021.1 MAG: hypothetical protein DI605_05285 [Sphingomonas sp.]
MDLLIPQRRDRITIAILALGGQGGGVLADWILDLADRNGFVAQGTSVPGVAQRTGSTVYYIEMVRSASTGANHPAPVMAMMPVLGDVDIVIASELMEAGRAILRGFVSQDRTTLIGSTHRIYAISEKAALGDGIGSSRRILDAAGRRSARFIGFDMEAAAAEAGSIISSVMFGALASSGALPFPTEAFEEAIRAGGKAVAPNLRGFAAGQAGTRHEPEAQAPADAPPEPTTPAGQHFKARILGNLPPSSHRFALEGVRRLMDYQDAGYAAFYLDRLDTITAVDAGADIFRLTALTARHLAAWMAYEDTIRVADLKVRASRRARITREVELGTTQVMTVTEYMHPRLREVCETIPFGLGALILRSVWLRRWLEPRFAKGRHVVSTGLRWYLALRLISALRRLRSSTARYAEEQDRINDWLALIREAAAVDSALACEIAECQVLLKGYGDTFERGLSHHLMILAVARTHIGRPEAAGTVRRLRLAALADDTGDCLRRAIQGDSAAA